METKIDVKKTSPYVNQNWFVRKNDSTFHSNDGIFDYTPLSIA